MARYKGPRVRISRRFGQPIFGPSKYLERRAYPPGVHGPKKSRRKQSDYAIGLAEKQKLRYQYGLLERQFRRMFEIARKKVGDLLLLDDIVLENINLTKGLENAIEAKMVQEQEAARARFAQQQAQTEASTAVIKARGEAESINLRGKALRENPSILELQIVERWDGITPLVVGPGAAGANMVLPLGNMKTGDQAPGK